MAAALRPAAGSMTALIRDDPAIVWEQAWNDKIYDAAELRDGAQCGGYRLPQAVVRPCSLGLQCHDVDLSGARNHEAQPPQFWMALADFCDLFWPDKHPLDFGRLVGAAHPTLDTHVAAAART